MPATSSEDRLTAATQDLIEILQQPHPATPFLNHGDRTHEALKKLETIFLPPQQDNQCTAQASPRVRETQHNNQPETNQQTPRVATTRRSPRVAGLNIGKNNNVIPTGTIIQKRVGNKTYEGEVIENNNPKLYRIKYKDGDIEDMTLSEIQTHKPTQQGKTNQHAYAVYDDDTKKALEYRHLIKHPDPTTRTTWNKAGANEFGRLMQGIGKNRQASQKIKGMNTMRFIHKYRIPDHKHITYARFVADVRP
jgi:hypothetical protein